MSSYLYFLLLLGLVSLLSDLTYEGARGVIGPYLAFLGASAPVVGFVSGLGEFIGYSFRLLSGYLVDKLKAYWGFVFFGYALNLFAIPTLGLVGRWDLAVLLLILERIGKALRTPARDTLISLATVQIGRGKGFGIHEALDQIGAIIGPLLVALILSREGSYREAFFFLFIPSLLALSILVLAKKISPKSIELSMTSRELGKVSFPKSFWLYIIGISLVGAGFADFPLMGFHFQKINHFSKELVPLLYAIAMGFDALSALILGILFDKKGFSVVLWALLFSLLAPPLVFLSTNIVFIILGVIFWGISLGAQESIMRATIAELLPLEKRGAGFGIFSALYGGFWFLGSFLMGILYTYSLHFLVILSIGLQALALPILFKVKKELKRTP